MLLLRGNQLWELAKQLKLNRQLHSLVTLMNLMIHHQREQALKPRQLFSLSNSQSSNQCSNKFNSQVQRCKLQCSSHQDKQSQHQKIIQLQCRQHQIIDRQIQKPKSQKENLMRAIAKQVVAKKISNLLKEIDQ